ncbi:uncharacterized protein BP01DRAFT_308024, partial [Aspergillus saccharolyticus JOP 1030-1]
LFISMKDSSLDFYIDYRDFNKILIKNYYFLFFILNIQNRISKSEYFSKINIKDIY